MVSFSWFLISFIFISNSISRTEGMENSPIYIEMVKSRGYPIEIHEVETEDGYLLNVFRIPHGRKSGDNGKPNPYPVLMQHGLFGCGEHFIWMNKSMGYLLADHGYDVWGMIVRGSSYSIKHKTLNPEKDSSYWRFTWHEIGIYDIPATIDYILNYTGAHNLSFIGHSQGATTMFVMGAFRPEYNDKVNGMIAIGPITVLLNPTDTATKLFASNYKLLRAIGRILNIQKFPPLISIDTIHAMNRFFCGKESFTLSICKRLLIAPSDDQFETELLPMVAPLTPSTCSYHQLIHYGQNFVDKKFTTFDWESAEENLRRYGSEKPVEYNTTNISFKVALYLSPNDVFVSDQSEQLLMSTLPNISEVYKVPYVTWTHIDFIWGKDMDIYEHPNILQTLNSFTNN